MYKLIQRSFLNALAMVAYITVVALIMSNGARIFGPKDTIFIPITVLTLFVLSAAVTGSLLLGKPILMYLKGEKKDAITLFLYTLGWLALTVVILLLVNLR